MPFVFSIIASFFTSIVGKFLTDNLLKWVALKSLIFLVLTTILPVVLKNIINWLFETMSSIVSSSISSYDLSPYILKFQGLAGYLSSHLMISDGIAILMTALVIRFVLNFIPFIG